MSRCAQSIRVRYGIIFYDFALFLHGLLCALTWRGEGEVYGYCLPEKPLVFANSNLTYRAQILYTFKLLKNCRISAFFKELK